MGLWSLIELFICKVRGWSNCKMCVDGMKVKRVEEGVGKFFSVVDKIKLWGESE